MYCFFSSFGSRLVGKHIVLPQFVREAETLALSGRTRKLLSANGQVNTPTDSLQGPALKVSA